MEPRVQPKQATQDLDFNSFFADLKDKANTKHNKTSLEELLISKSTVRLAELFAKIANFNQVNKILDTEHQYLTKLLALVIIKKTAQEFIEELEEEQDPQNKLAILSEGILKIQQIQKDLVMCLPEVESPVFKHALKLPASDFAHFQNKDSQTVGDILDVLANKAFKLAYETSEAIVSSTDIADQIFRPIFAISKNLQIGKEEKLIYINKIKANIKKIYNTEKITENSKLEEVQLISTDQADEQINDPKKFIANNIIVYRNDSSSNGYVVSYIMIKTRGVIKKYYLRNEQQYQAFNTLINDSINMSNRFASPNKFASPSKLKAKLLKKKSPCVVSIKDNKEIMDCFDSLIGANLKYQESQCKVAYNEFSGFRRFYIEQQKLCIKEINAYLKKSGPKKNIDSINFSKKNALDTDEQYNQKACEEIDEKIIPMIQMLLDDARRGRVGKKNAQKDHQVFLDNLQQVLTNYRFGYRSVSLLSRNYESIKKFEESTLKTWESSTTGYEKNINQLLDAIRLNSNKFGYHKGYIIYLANYSLKLEDCKKTPMIVYDRITKKISYLITNDGKGKKVKVFLSNLSQPERYKFNHFIRRNTLKNVRTFERVFLDYQDKLTPTITSMHKLRNESSLKNFIYAPTRAERPLHNNLKSVTSSSTNSSIRKLKFGEDKFLIIKEDSGEVNIVHHHGGNRLYKPQDVLPASKDIPTALFLLGVGHFGDVKAGFLPSGEQKAIKVVRLGSTNTSIKRKFHKDVWDEREDDVEREITGLRENNKLIACGNTRSYLKKITKIKKELLKVTEEKLAITDMPTRSLIKNRNSDGAFSTSRSSTSSQQGEEQQSVTFMAGTATHILMQSSGSKELREEVEEKIQPFLPTQAQDFKNYFSYFINRAIECCDILEEQHKTGTHNDFKLANIIVTRDGGLELIDFGTYQQRGGVKLRKQRLNPIVHGTPAFMNPSALQEVHKELAKNSIPIKTLCDIPVVSQTNTPTSLKEYYIKRRLHDVLGNETINIKNIKDIQQLIIKLLTASYEPVPLYKLSNKSVGKKTKPVTIFNENVQLLLGKNHQSQKEYRFTSANNDYKWKKITWTVKEEIDFLLKAIETSLKNRPTSRSLSMGCDDSYDMYSLVSTLSGTANKQAYLTNIILRYGNLNNEDLSKLFADNDADLIPIQNYLGEGQGLQLDALFNNIKKNLNILKFTNQQQQDFENLYKKWIYARNNILLPEKSDKKFQPKDFKEIFLEFKKIILGEEVTVKNKGTQEEIDKKTLILPKGLEEFLSDAATQQDLTELEESLNVNVDLNISTLKPEHLEKILIDHNQPMLLILKRFLIKRFQVKQCENSKYDKIKFITDLCYENYPGNIASVILKLFQSERGKMQQALVNFYKILANIVFPVDDSEDNDAIIKNRKLAAGVFFSSMPQEHDLSSMPAEITKILTDDEKRTVDLVHNAVVNEQVNIFNTIFNSTNIKIFQEDFIDISPSLWSKKIDACDFFNKQEYTDSLYSLIEHNKIELFKKLFDSLSVAQKEILKKELLWVRAVAEKYNSKDIVACLGKKVQYMPTILLDEKAILDFMLKKYIKPVKQSKTNATLAKTRQSSIVRRLTSYTRPSRCANVSVYDQSRDFNLSEYDKETLDKLISVANSIDIPCKPSLIEQFVEKLKKAKKLKEDSEQKVGAEILVAYKNDQLQDKNIIFPEQLDAQFDEAWTALKIAQGNYDRLNSGEHLQQKENNYQEQEYDEAWAALKVAQGNYDRLMSCEYAEQEEVLHKDLLGIKTNRNPNI